MTPRPILAAPPAHDVVGAALDRLGLGVFADAATSAILADLRAAYGTRWTNGRGEPRCSIVVPVDP